MESENLCTGSQNNLHRIAEQNVLRFGISIHKDIRDKRIDIKEIAEQRDEEANSYKNDYNQSDYISKKYLCDDRSNNIYCNIDLDDNFDL